jgi:hypothetical protein
MMGRRMSTRCLAVAPVVAAAAIAWVAGARSEASEFFGPSQGLQIQPEVEVIQDLGEAFRVVAKVEPTFIPSESSSEMGISLYGDWLVAPFVSAVVSPDLTKRRRLDVRVGLSWYPTTQPGAAGWSDLLQLEAEASARTNVPGQILVTWRNRAEARWQLDQPTSFVWRLRTRLQLEREFDLSRDATVALTPFANVELIWSTSQDMWSQFRVQAGLQLAVDWFGKGQVIELNGSVITYLQPSRSHSPVIGVVCYQYF